MQLGPSATLKEGLEALNRSGRVLTVFIIDDQERLVGSLTDGDIRRGLLNGIPMSATVDQVMNRAPRTLEDGAAAGDLIADLKRLGIRSLPLIDDRRRLRKVIDLAGVNSILPVEAVLMAGGRGERLRPFTDSIPKPLIPVHGKPIIEHSLELLSRYGIERVAISVNYLRDMIMEHLGNGSEMGLDIRYIIEDQPLGTAGALGLITDLKYEVVLLMNSDLLTDVDLDSMYKCFKAHDADIVVATTSHTVDLPYAVMELDGDRIRSFQEKPSLLYPCNAGIYLINKRVFNLIPPTQVYNATDLIKDLLDRGLKVIAFPISGYWYDIGKHEDLDRARIEHNGK